MHPCKQDEGQTDHIRQRSTPRRPRGVQARGLLPISAQASMVIRTWILMHASETCVLGHLYSQRGDHSLWFQDQVILHHAGAWEGSSEL